MDKCRHGAVILENQRDLPAASGPTFMAFRFKIDEPIEKGFRRVGAEQIEKARRQLSANADPAAEVHEARKCMKRARALLRLGRNGLGETVYRAENAQLRSIAQSLSGARD